MKRIRLISAAFAILMIAMMLLATSCFGANANSTSTNNNGTPAVVKPQPVVESTTATTSGMQDNYFTTLNIKVKNNGADGMILVVASVTQGGNTTTREDHSFIKNGASCEFAMTFPLIWKGGDFTYSVQAALP